jgi:anthranilate synthase component 1
MTTNINKQTLEIPIRSCAIRSSDLPADLDTPISAFLKLRPLGASFLLESAESVDVLGRYSFIGFKSRRGLIADGSKVTYRDNGESRVFACDPLDAVKHAVSACRIRDAADAPGLLGAAVGCIGYDYVRFIEKLPEKHASDGMPLCRFTFVETLVVFDHLMRKMKVFSLVDEDGRGSIPKHDEILSALESPTSGKYLKGSGAAVDFKPNTSAEEYGRMVQEAKRYIHAGDSFQIVLSRRLRADIKSDGFEIYRQLRMGNPSPYMFYLDFGDMLVVGSSPEALVKLTGRRAFISPIAGTRPRGASKAEDLTLEKDLLADEKERAEHVMLVDLARNDLGRVCDYGSVKVEGFMRVERYSHVMHIVSDVFGELSSGRDQFDLFRAAFPAGTVTGAPKVRAMEIIAEQEKEPRGIYAGAVGYFSPSGDMDTCIAIRMVVIKDGVASLQAGAGIVADSEPEKEFQETERKLAALKVALEATGG